MVGIGTETAYVMTQKIAMRLVLTAGDTGELSIIGALTAGHFTRAHQKLARGPSPPPSA